MSPKFEWIINVNGTSVLSAISTSKHDTEKGLGGVDLKPAHGMLFVFTEPKKGRTFWMKDCVVPLDMLFLDENKRVVDVVTKEMHDLKPYSCAEPSQYVFEMLKGEADRMKVVVGKTKLEFGKRGV